MPTIAQVCQFLNQFAPTHLAEEWDNVGLLAGDPALSAERIMTCLTITPESAAEAISHQANLIVAHHPLPFRPLKRITTETIASRMVWDLIRAGIAIYSPHTGFDSATQGINQSLGERLELVQLAPLKPTQEDPQIGSGRFGSLVDSLKLESFLQLIKTKFQLKHLQFIGDPSQTVARIGIACGSGGSFLRDAIDAGCDTFVTGETNFHTALEAKANGVSMVLMGHFHSERFAVEQLAEKLTSNLGESTHVWASQSETDPVQFA